MKCFIDANVILRFLLSDDALYFNKSVLIFEAIAEGKFSGYVNSLVIHEVLYVAIYVYKQDKKTNSNTGGDAKGKKQDRGFDRAIYRRIEWYSF